MKRILIGWMAALSALLCACSAQTVWETVDGGCVQTSGGAAYAICISLPQDAAEEVFAERGARQIYTQPGGGYEITTEILDAAPAAAIVRRLSGMYLCRHKTRKPLFTVTVPLLLLAQCTILYFLFR